MKKLKVTDASQCKACLACENACSTAFYKTFDPDLSCIQIGQKPNGDIAVKVCIQCGKCARTCPAGAITQNAKGTYIINKKLCTKCGECVKACPMGVMVKPTEDAVPTKCIACGICAKACPMGILEIVE